MGGYHPIGAHGNFTHNSPLKEEQQSDLHSALVADNAGGRLRGLDTLREYNKNENMKNMKMSTQDKVEGAAKNIAGSVKVVAGKVTDSQRLQAEGKLEKAEGHVQKKIGQIEKVLGS
jgi:uncharacterized protein YjbJ (UPF0337 family)